MITATRAIDSVNQLRSIQAARLAAPAVNKKNATEKNGIIKSILKPYTDLFAEPKTAADYDRAWAILRSAGSS